MKSLYTLIVWFWFTVTPAVAATLILDSTPGSTIDAFGQATQPWLTQQVKDPVDVIYKTGAAGRIAQQSLVTSPPNTFLLTYIRPDDIVDLTDRGVTALGQFGLPEIVLFTTIDSNLDLTQSATAQRSTPVRLAFLSQTSWRDYWSLVFGATGVGENFVPVPVAKVSEIQQLVLGGHVDVGAVSSGTVVSWNQGRESFRPLLVLSSHASKIYPNAPVLGNLTARRDYEQRLSKLTLLASPGTDQRTVKTLQQEFHGLSRSSAIQQLVQKYGFSQ